MNAKIFVVGLCLASGSAAAQSTLPHATSPTSPPNAGDSGAPIPAPVPDSGIKDTPSASVIHPGNPDPGMTVRPPAMGITPVVPPPGTGGNAPNIIPK